MRRSFSLIIFSSFLSLIALGTVLLLLPVATHTGSIKFVDALFTASSAVTVTGLVVADTATYFSPFGQTVILVLLQIGGLGFMTFSTLFLLLIGRSVPFQDKLIIENDFTTGSYSSIRDLIRKIFLLTVSFELIGSLLLYIQFRNLNVERAAFSAVFHSISAFCNAGFSVFSNSFEDFIGHPGINVTLMALIICGGLGFLVLNEVYMWLRKRIRSVNRFSLHTKLVLLTSLLLIIGGFLAILVVELCCGKSENSLGTTLLSALFQSVTARTAGFSTININIFSHASIFILLLLMFIGAAPGSTGGGIKTSTFGTVLAYFRCSLKGQERINLFYRNIPVKTVEKAFIVIILSFIFISFSFLLMLVVEKGTDMIPILFETVSAFGTVGLSLGITGGLSVAAKLIISFTMLIGRIGPLTLLLALSRKESKGVFNYPEENIMIG